ncbi:MAG: hypothetical protein IGS38_03380 [Synechococcales cyanobacterium M58_A2018_015]|nr:hypothetical protein [Synechococcales cyanobacterium M58_A2018_015]
MPNPPNRRVAALLAFAGVIPLPGLHAVAGLHKFYLGQAGWGWVYLLLGFLPIPTASIACAVEGLWFLFQDPEEFNQRFSQDPGAAASPRVEVMSVAAVAEALHQLEQLRQEGLVSEYEFEQKRRQLLNRVG